MGTRGKSTITSFGNISTLFTFRSQSVHVILCSRHFIGTVSYNCKYSATTIYMKIGEEKFSFTGKKVTELGFTAVMTWQAISDEETVPSVNKGLFFRVNFDL